MPLLAGTVASQQLDLDGVHGIDVRVTQCDRALELRVAIEQSFRLDDLEHALHGTRPCSVSSSAQMRSGSASGGQSSR